MNYEIKEVAIDKLKTDNLQIRVTMQDECIDDYAALYRDDPAALPPVTVFYDVFVDAYYLADGFHRVAAAKRSGRDKIAAEIHEGTRCDALKFALSANDKHGLRRTNADKRNAMRIAWENRKQFFNGMTPSSRQLATICGVHHDTANNFLKLYRVSDSDTPSSETIPAEVPSALKPTREHLEERNASVRAQLAAGKDRYGVEIPERIKSAFLSREPRMLIRELSRVFNTLEERRLAGDIAFAHTISYAMRDLDAAIRDLRQGEAHCVCRMCRGTGCASCSDLGFQTKLQYDRVPSEYKVA